MIIVRESFLLKTELHLYVHFNLLVFLSQFHLPNFRQSAQSELQDAEFILNKLILSARKYLQFR